MSEDRGDGKITDEGISELERKYSLATTIMETLLGENIRGAFQLASLLRAIIIKERDNPEKTVRLISSAIMSVYFLAEKVGLAKRRTVDEINEVKRLEDQLKWGVRRDA